MKDASMKTWWIVVRHASPEQLANVSCDCDICQGRHGGTHPPEGFAISAFDDEARARAFAASSTSVNHKYEAIPVVRK